MDEPVHDPRLMEVVEAWQQIRLTRAAFPALLAAAQRAAIQWETDGCPFCATETDDTWHDAEMCPIGQLNAAHPDWRAWTPDAPRPRSEE